jgi:hypothetical protein
MDGQTDSDNGVSLFVNLVVTWNAWNGYLPTEPNMTSQMWMIELLVISLRFVSSLWITGCGSLLYETHKDAALPPNFIWTCVWSVLVSFSDKCWQICQKSFVIQSHFIIPFAMNSIYIFVVFIHRNTAMKMWLSYWNLSVSFIFIYLFVIDSSIFYFFIIGR